MSYFSIQHGDNYLGLAHSSQASIFVAVVALLEHILRRSADGRQRYQPNCRKNVEMHCDLKGSRTRAMREKQETPWGVPC